MIIITFRRCSLLSAIDIVNIQPTIKTVTKTIIKRKNPSSNNPITILVIIVVSIAIVKTGAITLIAKYRRLKYDIFCFQLKLLINRFITHTAYDK